MIPDAVSLTPQFWTGLLSGLLLAPLLLLGLAAVISVLFDANEPKTNTGEGDELF